jgi:hypothetical protein
MQKERREIESEHACKSLYREQESVPNLIKVDHPLPPTPSITPPKMIFSENPDFQQHNPTPALVVLRSASCAHRSFSIDGKVGIFL